MRDYLVGALESTVPLLARAPRLYNAMLSTRGAQWALRRVAGLVDSPEISRYDWNAALRRANAESAHPDVLCRLTEAERRTSVIIVQDAFTRYFDTPVAAAFIELAKTAGCKVYIAPFLPNGKPLHVQGFLPAFERTARRNAAHLRALASFGIPLVGLDPAMTLTYRQEYPEALGKDACPSIALPQEWLLTVLPRRTQAVGRYRLAHHCTEISNAPQQAGMWVSLFERAGLELEPQRSGCCGMSGTYGHEARNVETSKKIFDLSWAAMVDPCMERELLATGYSCRSQAKRLRSQSLRHPVEVLLEHYGSGQADGINRN